MNERIRTPEIFLAHAPRGEGLRCALAYLSGERDVYGWFTGPRKDASIASGYFLIEGYYANQPMAYEMVDPERLHSAWSLAEPRRHELARMQDAFVHEWLEDRDVRAGWAGLQVREGMLTRFSTQQPTWTHYSPGFQHGVLRVLTNRWPLAYHAEGREEERPHRRAAGPRP